MPLATCPSCSRHVKVGESTCPFCESALPADLEARVQYRPVNPGRFGRAALVTFSAALATAATACASDEDDTGTDTGEQRTGGAGGEAGATASGGSAGAGMGSGGASVGGSAGEGMGGQLAQPVYGIPVDPGDPNIGQPEYGVPVDFDAGDPNANNPVESDGGTNTADGGASEPDGGGGPVITPVYGIAID